MTFHNLLSPPGVQVPDMDGPLPWPAKPNKFLYEGCLYLSIKARNVCLSVCVCVCVFLKYLCRSGSHWSESLNMAAAWFKGVRRRISLDCNDTVKKLFHKCFTNSTSIVHRSHHSHVCTRANHCSGPRHTLRNKQIYTCSSASWTRILPAVRSRSVVFCASKLTVVD